MNVLDEYDNKEQLLLVDFYILNEPLMESFRKMSDLCGEMPFTKAILSLCKIEKIVQKEVKKKDMKRGHSVDIDNQNYIIKYIDWNNPLWGGNVSVIIS